MATAADPLPDRGKSILPLPNVFLGCTPVFDEQQLAAWFQHAAHFLKRSSGIGYGAQRPGGHEGINAAAIDRDRLR